VSRIKPLPALLIVACLSAIHAAEVRPLSRTSAQADFLMGPYVNRVGETSARLLWVSTPGMPPQDVVVEDGGRRMTVPSVPSPIPGRPELLHEAVLDGLTASTRYKYRIGPGAGAPAGSFVTAPAGPPYGGFRFVVYGDTRSDPDRHLLVSTAIAAEDPAFVVCTGDLVEGGRAWNDWETEFFGPAMPYLSKAPLWPVVGNHEEDAVLYRALFDLPNNELYYSFDYGNAHFVVLDSEHKEVRPAMVKWLEDDLAGHASADWTFMFYHTPTFNVGGHRSKWGQEDVLPLLESHGVDFVITGHSHIYERFLPIGAAGKKPIIHIVSAGGGAPDYGVSPSPILAGGIGKVGLHYCVFEVNGDKCDMTAKRPDGEVWDRLSLVKKDGSYQPEVQAQAIETAAAERMRLMFVHLAADFESPPGGGAAGAARTVGNAPRPGESVQVTVLAPDFVAGSTVTVRQARDEKAWQVVEQKVKVNDGKFVFTVRAPAKLEVNLRGIHPSLRVALTVEDGGHVYSVDNLALRVAEDTLRKTVAGPVAVDIPYMPREVTVDGDLSEWAGVKSMPLPFQKAQTSSFRLAWREDGLYGAVEASDASLRADPAEPWAADTVEIFVEKDAARSLGRTGNTAQYALSPAPDTGPGPAHVLTAYGDQGRQSGIQCAWRPVRGGYVLEFFIPAATLEPAKMAAGSVLGLNFARSDDGVPVEQFYCDKNPDGWQKPILWGAVRLVE